MMSNFVFEGFIATIKRQFHGTRGIVPQMVRNIGVLQNTDAVSNKIGGTPHVQAVAKKLAQKMHYSERLQIDEDSYLYGPTLEHMPIIEGVIIPQDVQMSLVDEGILFGKRLWKNSEVFHSLSYLRRKTSNSYMVSFSYQNKEKYGSVLFFTSYGHVVVKLFQITGQKLYTEDSLDATTNGFIQDEVLGSCFYHVAKTNEIVIISTQCLIHRMIFVPDSPDNLNSGFLSHVLKSYQHD